MSVSGKKIRLIIFDLAGTIVDYGSLAPARAFVELFARNGLRATEKHARAPMGMHKRDHIRLMLEEPDLSRQWRETRGGDWTEADLEKLFQEFMPIQLSLLPRYSSLIPGAAETVRALRLKGVSIAVTTGYNRRMTELVLSSAAKQGLEPDCSVCAAETVSGRPAPWMIFRCMEKTDSYPPSAVVKIGDTIADVHSGRNAGVWSIGVALTGNLMGLSEPEVLALSESECSSRLESARRRLADAGAHAVIDTLFDFFRVYGEIEASLARGETP